jgi:hypothetical protein
MISKEEIFEEYMLVETTIVDKKRLVFCALHGPAKEEGVYISQIFYSDLSNWQEGLYHNMEVVSMAKSPSVGKGIYLLDREGVCLQISNEKKQVFDFKSSNEVVGPFRKIRNIGDELYVIGEERSVWVMRDSMWHRQENGISQKESLPEPGSSDFDEDEYISNLIEHSEIMFSISGSGANDLCLVGTSGEIWTWNGKIWEKESSPTNQNLYDVYCLNEGHYIICGQNGTILIGGKGEWHVIESNNDHSDFCSITKFRDKFYLADGHNLFEYNGDELSPIDFGVGDQVPSHFVASSDQIIVTLAAKEAFFSRDGSYWESLLM